MPGPASARQKEKGRRRWLLPAAAGGVLLALLVPGLIVFRQRPEPVKAAVEPSAPAPGAKKIVTNSIGMKLMPIEAGTFWMGSPRAEAGRKDDEREHEVVLTRPFLIGVYEVTVGQFRAFVEATGYQTDAEKTGEGSIAMAPGVDGKPEWKMDAKATWKNPGFAQTDDHPVVCVSRRDAGAFTQWLTLKEGAWYGLPTEAQWEYCCRAGSTKKFSFGEDKTKGDEYAWYDGNAAGASHPVGTKKPNAWGLFDMHGNAAEWCGDFYDKDAYTNGPQEDPHGPRTGRNRVLRGSGWHDSIWRVAARSHQLQPYRTAALGFRVVLMPDVFVANSLDMMFRHINPGSFTMGSPAKEPGRGKDEQMHAVNLTKPFWIGVHEVKVGQFARFVKGTGYRTTAEKDGAGSFHWSADGAWKKDPKITWRNPGFGQTDDHPVVCVSWYDASEFCAWLSKKEGKHYSLPTEAQWEYCCRAGSRWKFSFGITDANLAEHAWYRENAQLRAHPGGQKKPNPWGLHDMLGNAAEWCRDWYAADYPKGPLDNPSGPAAGAERVGRGGGWLADPAICRAAMRFHRDPGFSNSATGFRVAILPEEVVTNGIGMKLKLIGTGKFTMGSPPSEPGRDTNEEPHEVAITRPFYLGVYPVTVGQFAAFVKDAGYKTEAEKGGGANRMFPDNIFKVDRAANWRKPGFAQADEHPVVAVSWNDATAFCAWLSKKEGRRYTLPTEAQWEYACRAGSRTRYFFGDDERKLGDYAWTIGNSKKHTHPVGTRKPNAWGLFDMHGNVNERMKDWYALDYAKISPRDDPPGPLEGATTVVRGGGWANPPANCRSAWRYGGYSRGGRSSNTGFRVALVY